MLLRMRTYTTQDYLSRLRGSLSIGFLGGRDGTRLPRLQRYLDSSCRRVSVSVRGQKPVRFVYCGSDERRNCHGEYGPTLNWSGGTLYGSQKWSGTIFGCRKWSSWTNYGCHKRSPPAITGPGRTIRGSQKLSLRSCLLVLYG